jgi:hypothetical protein
MPWELKYTKFGPDIMVLDTTYQRRLLGLGTIHYVVSGQVKNIGSWLLPSYGTQVQINVIANDTEQYCIRHMRAQHHRI